MLEDPRVKDAADVEKKPCDNELCFCTVDAALGSPSFCSDYCRAEDTDVDGQCQCGHVGCA